jgi:hypothetical protein
MHFRLSRFLNVCLSTTLAVLFCSAGLLAIVLPWSPDLQNEAARLLFGNSLVLVLLGCGLVFMGISLFTYAMVALRRRYMTIRTGDRSIKADMELIHQYLAAYWREKFPATPILCRIHVHKQSLQVIADLPYVPLEEQKQLLKKASDDFAELFGRVLGSSYDVQLIASFDSQAAGS